MDKKQLSEMNLSEDEINKLYQNFKSLDKDGNDQLEPEEILGLPDLEQNPLVKRVIDVMDKDGDGKISFLEFVQGLTSLSAGASAETKLEFAFKIYDIDGDGFISNGELFSVLKMMVGDNLTDSQL